MIKTKRLLYLFFIVFLALFFWNKKSNNNRINWQFYVADQIGGKWVKDFADEISFDEHNLFFSDSGNTVYSLDKKTGKINWTRKMQDHSPFKVAIDQGLVYVASFDSHIYCLDKKTGFIVWSFAIPNQYWPEAEVIFDENDEFVFFADRGGFLRALDKKSGIVTWEKQFSTIDNTRNFIEGTIHFGIIRQDDDLLYIKHFPSDRLYVINKKNGTDNKIYINQDEIGEIFDGLQLSQNPIHFELEDYSISIKTDFPNRHIFELLDKNKNLIWAFRSEYQINANSVYLDEDRLYFLNVDNTILNSILINEKNPNRSNFKKLNFKLVENFNVRFPYKNANPQIKARENKFNFPHQIRKLSHKLTFFVKNLKQLGKFNIIQEEKNGYIEFSIDHQENFYKNVFTQIDVLAVFTNQEGKKLSIKGFYYKHNQWKIRVKLEPGWWNWQIKTKTPYWTDKQTGTIAIIDQKSKKIKIEDDCFVDQNDQVFFPIGLQGVIIDTNQDGNPLNQMDHAQNSVATQDPKEFRFLEYTDYLDLYIEEAGINFFRYGPDNWAPFIWKNLGNKKSFAMDINGNLQGDIILNELRRREIKSIMSIFAFYPPYISQETFAKKANRQVLKQYLDYVIARYAVLVDIWELGNETIPPLEWLNFISNYLHNNDPYQHPITTSFEQPLLDNSDLLSIHWFAPTPANNLKLFQQVNYLKTKDNWQQAIMISEWGFEKQNQFFGSTDIMRKFTWISLFKGMGMIYWNTGYGLYESETNGNIYLGPIERAYLKEISNFLPQLKYPLQKNCQTLEENNLVFCSMENNDYLLIYLLKIDKNKKLSKNKLSLTIDQSGLLEIVNPKNGQVLEKQTINKNIGEIDLPNFADDLAIKITYD